MDGVWFDSIHSYKHFQMILIDFDNPLPEAKTSSISIDGADGDYDTTYALSDITFYKNRKPKFIFQKFYNPSNHSSFQSKLANLLHGKIKKIRLDEDPNYYYYGRVKVVPSGDKKAAEIIIECDCDPYKYAINETNIFYDVTEETTYYIDYKGTKVITPTIICTIANDSTLELILKDTYYALQSGINIIPDFLLRNGINEFKLVGVGQVEMIYREAIL